MNEGKKPTTSQVAAATLQQTTDKPPHTPKEYRCRCGRLLGIGLVEKGVISVKCPRCRKVAIFSANDEQAL